MFLKLKAYWWINRTSSKPSAFPCRLPTTHFLLSFKCIRTLLQEMLASSFPSSNPSNIVSFHYCIHVPAPRYMSLENKHYHLFFNAEINICIINICYFQVSSEFSLETHPNWVYAITTLLKHLLSTSSMAATWLYLLSK